MFWARKLTLLGQSVRTGTMHFLRGKIEVLAFDVISYIGLNFYVWYVTPLIIGSLYFFESKKKCFVLES